MENGAKLSVTEVTNPILLDVNGPSAGFVVDGVDYLHDKEYLGSTTEVSGKNADVMNECLVIFLWVYYVDRV